MERVFHPLGNRVVVKRVDQEEKTASGIIIPDTAQEKPMEGEVVAVGPGEYQKGKRVPMSVSVGDRVIFGKWSGDEMKVGDQEYLIITEDNIIGILK